MNILFAFADDSLPSCLRHLEPTVDQANGIGMAYHAVGLGILDRPTAFGKVSIDEYRIGGRTIHFITHKGII
jgi:hypothetical protein